MINHRRGFTLVEILVTLVIVGIILWALINFQVAVFSENTFLSNSLTADSELRSALKRIVAELRGAAQANTGTYQLAATTKNNLIFYSDIDGDGLREQLRYYLAGSTFYRGLIKPTGSPLAYIAGNEKVSTLVYHLANPNQEIFNYYDENYTGTQAALAEPVNIPLIRLIKITLTVDADPARPPAPLTLTSQVAVRSLKY